MDRLIRALDVRAEAGDPVRLWLRDDDAVVPSAPLDRLLALAGGIVPLTLAVIPAETGAALAARLVDAAGVSVAVHGWAHRNHAPLGEKTAELGAHRPARVVLEEAGRGLRHLSALHGARLVPLMVPPWNRIAPAVVAGLRDEGFRALSVFGPEAPAPLTVVNTHVDVIDWRGSRGGKPEAVLVAEILARMQSGGAVGILTHHLVHDAAVWTFLERLIAATRAHPGCRWVAVERLIEGCPPAHRRATRISSRSADRDLRPGRGHGQPRSAMTGHCGAGRPRRGRRRPA